MLLVINPPVTLKVSCTSIKVELSDLITSTTKSAFTTKSPVPFGSSVMSAFVDVEPIVFPVISMALLVESKPKKS